MTKAWIFAAMLMLLTAPAVAATGQPGEAPDGQPDETPDGQPDETPDGPPDEYPGPGDFPADPSEHFPDEGCGHAPARPSGVPSWVPLPFDGCGGGDEGETSG